MLKTTMKVLMTVWVCLFISFVYGQERIEGEDGDVSSIENITTALLESISGPKGQKRDWERFRKLFWPTAQLNAILHKGDSTWVRINSLDGFVSAAGTSYEDNGFREIELGRKIERFGHIAHVFQSYSASLADGKEIQRGVNSYQLAYINNRWWIINLIYDRETEKTKLPENF